MKTRTIKTLPKRAAEITNGGVYAQRVRCGKSNCKCARGELHLAFYFFTRQGGKLLKFYIRKSEVADFIELVEQANLVREQKRRSNKTSNKLLSNFRRELLNNDSLIKAMRGEFIHGQQTIEDKS